MREGSVGRDRTLTGNIRSRRGAKVAINVPIFRDVDTPSPFIDPTIPWDRTRYPGDDGMSGSRLELDVRVEFV